MNLTKNVEYIHATTPGTIGSSRTCATVDMANAQGLALICPVEQTTSSTAGSVTLRWTLGDSSGSLQNATTGTGYLTQTTTAAAAMDDMFLVLDSYHFNHRWVAATIDGTTGNVIGSAVYVKYNVREASPNSTASDGVRQSVITAGPTTS